MNKKINNKKRKFHRRNHFADIDWEKVTKIFQEVPVPHDYTVKKFPKISNILHILAAAGTIGLIFAFPGAAPAFGSLVIGSRKYTRWRTKQIISQLAKQKYVKIDYLSNGQVRVKITRNGLSRALSYKLELMVLKKPRWDKKWRVIIFDIPEKHRRLRDVFRMRLKQLGLIELQESVYVCPYPCFNEIEFLRELYGVAFKVLYLLVEKMENDSYLKEKFNLN